MNKKNLNIAGIQNELKGASLFFPGEEGAKQAAQGPEMAQNGTSVAIPVFPVLSPKKEQSSISQKEVSLNPTPTNEPTKEAPIKRNNEHSVERTKVRHTFDIFKDQLSSLRRIQVRREDVFGKRDLLGDLVQEAIDMYITKERNNE